MTTEEILSLERWQAVWRRLRAQADPTALYHDLIDRYSEPHRHYHTLTHLAHCLAELDSARELCADAGAVELALWYHDAVYVTHAHDNEERSADLCARASEALGMTRELIDKVRELILATKHQHQPVDIDEQVIVDIDLAILGQP